jgi:hypothetical protein
MENNASPFASQADILALLATPVREVTITKDETPLESVLAGMTSLKYESESGIHEFSGLTFRHVAISAKTGKQYATFKTEDGKYKSFFTAQIQF